MEMRHIGIGKTFTLADDGIREDTGIDVFHLDLDEALMDGELDADEQQACSRFVTERLRQRYRQSHLAKRAILAAYLRTRPESLRFSRGAYGKPAIEGSAIEFSMSHSHGWCTVAVSRSQIGVDCEMHRDDGDIPAMASLIAHHGEKIVGTESFYRTWTRKEAVMKQLGLGMSLEPRRLRVANEPAIHLQWMPTFIDGEAEAPHVADVPAPPGVFAAVAARLPGSVRTFRLTGDPR